MEEGYATAEAAVALPALVAVLGLAIGALATIDGQLRCVDAARAGARVAARGEGDTAVRQAAAGLAPGGARVAVDHLGDEVRVTVQVTVRAGRWMPGVPLTARATAEAE